MMTADVLDPLIPDRPGLPAAGASPDGRGDLVAAFLVGRRPTKFDAYRRALADFARFLGAAGPGPAVEWLISGRGAGEFNRPGSRRT